MQDFGAHLVVDALLDAMVNMDAGRKAIFGALRLYLDFLNLFLFLIQLMGNRR